MKSICKTALSFCLLMFCFTLLTVNSFAQTITATVSGVVTDPNGAVVPGVAVTAKANETGQSKTATTDAEGRYTITFLPPGTYNLTYNKSGFADVVRENIRLEIAQTATLDTILGVSADTVSVNVSDETPILQTETSNLETTVEEKLVEDLPSAERNIFSFVNLVPGTIDVGTARGADSGANPVGSAGNRNFFDSNFSVNGGRASSNDVLLDGVTNTIGDFNGIAISPPQDSIREFKVLSGVAPAEYGRTAGGIITIATKAGTNKFHGALYEYFQDRELNANGFVRNRNRLERININRNQFGGAIGGPIYLPRFGEGGPVLYNGKNKSFFFFNYEARREDNPFSRELLTVPTAAERRGDLSSLLDTGRTYSYSGVRNGVAFNEEILLGSGAAATSIPYGQIFNPFGPLVTYTRRTTNAATGAVATTTFQGRAPFANNDLSRLPVCSQGSGRTTACLDPVALSVLGFIPLPNAPGIRQISAINGRPIPGVSNNFVISDTVKFTRDIFAGRIDQQISENQRIFGRFSYEVRRNAEPSFFNSVATRSSFLRDTFMNFTLNHAYTISQNTVNNFRYGYTRVKANLRPLSDGFSPSNLGFPDYLAQGASKLLFPNFTIGGGNDGETLPGQINANAIGAVGNEQPRDVHTLNNSVNIVSGAHSIKFGGEYRLLRFFPFQFFNPSGNFTFNRNFTRLSSNVAATNSLINPLFNDVAVSGSALASFLLGLPSQAQREAIAPITIYHHYGAGFVQDDWRVRPNLVLNLGVRYDYETGTAEVNNLVSSFDFDRSAPVQPAQGFAFDRAIRELNPGITNVKGFLSFPEGPQTATPKTRFAPRVGFAYSFDKKTTLRGGYGIFFLPQSLEGTTAQGVNFTTSTLQSDNNITVLPTTVFLNDPFPASQFPGGLPNPSGDTLGERTLLGTSVFAVEPKRRNPYTQQWNLILQRQLAKNLVIDLAYVGARGIRLPVQQTNLNQISGSALEYARNNFNRDNFCSTDTQIPTLTVPCASVTDFFQQLVANPFAGQLPGSPLNGATVPRAQLLRPFPQYQNVTYFRPHIGESSYHALQVSLQKRFSDGISALVNYTWSKAMDTGGVGNGASFLDPSPVQDVTNYKGGEYSLSTLDVPHRLVLSSTYELPFGRGKRFGKDLNPILDFFFGGFQISGIATFQSGTPFQITVDGFTALARANAGFGNAVRRPNKVGENTFDRDIFRENARNGLPVIDPSAFATPEGFNFGNASRTHNDVRRDQYRNLDISLIKNFAFDERRQKIQLRVEFLNATNYVVFGTPVSNISSPNFGLVTTQGNRPRIIQLVGRYTF